MKAERDHNGNLKTVTFSPTEHVPTRRRRGRPCGANAARERSRVQTLRGAFLDLQKTLPSVPPDTKLSKLDILVLATTYIAHLMRTLEDGDSTRIDSTNKTSVERQIPLVKTYLHPVKKWPMRSRLYQGITTSTSELLHSNSENIQSCYNSNSSSDEEAVFTSLDQQM